MALQEIPESGIALTLFIEIVDKELLKYEVEKIRRRCTIDWKAITFLSLGEKGLFWRKGPHNMAVALHACLLQVAFYVKARLCRSQNRQGACTQIAMTVF